MSAAAELRAAAAAGRRAGELGKEVTACPYPAGNLRVMWVRWYVYARNTRDGWPT